LAKKIKSKLRTPWGFEGVVISTELYAAKIMVVKNGEQTPYTYNKTQDKTIYVLQGVANFKIEGTNRMLSEGERYHVLPKMMHKIHAIKGDVTILEVGTKIEDDVVEVEE
jgi:mannose-6-phosphate isomerase-like protein (cupin superfamily)